MALLRKTVYMNLMYIRISCTLGVTPGWCLRIQKSGKGPPVVAVAREWGERCVERFNGMFAFAIHDTNARRVYLVRDRHGVKPIYWARWGQTILFGSEQRAILAHPEARREVDREAMLEYFTFQNFFTDRTLLKDIRLLPAATTMTIRRTAAATPPKSPFWLTRWPSSVICGLALIPTPSRANSLPAPNSPGGPLDGSS